MSSAGYEDTLRKLQLVRDEIDLTQRGVDDSARGANVNEALVTVADALWVASEALDFYEGTDEFPEECRAVMFEVLRALHHMVLTVKLRGP
ncbi:MAG: hypothetical protein WAN86_16810 [Hyphomicrobiaceae bacterium]